MNYLLIKYCFFLFSFCFSFYIKCECCLCVRNDGDGHLSNNFYIKNGSKNNSNLLFLENNINEVSIERSKDESKSINIESKSNDIENKSNDNEEVNNKDFKLGRLIHENKSSDKKLSNNSIFIYKNKILILLYKIRDDGDYDVIYTRNKLFNDHVYKNVLWWQSMIIKKGDLENFISCLIFHFNNCCKGYSLRNYSSAIFKDCCSNCKMKEYDDYFLQKTNVNVEFARKEFEESFFSNNRHARKTNFKDFFMVIANRFLKYSCVGESNKEEIIFSEKNNRKFTYLYLLTDKYMYELGFNIESKVLFLMHIDLVNNYKHFNNYCIFHQISECLQVNSRYFGFNVSIEHLYESLFDVIWQYDLKNDEQQIYDNEMNEFEKAFSEDILKIYKNGFVDLNILLDKYKDIKLF